MVTGGVEDTGKWWVLGGLVRVAWKGLSLKIIRNFAADRSVLRLQRKFYCQATSASSRPKSSRNA